MATIEEKRVYSDRDEPTPVYVASELGLVRAKVSGDIVGEFEFAARCTARDAAGEDGLLAVATDEDVLVGADHEETGFGPAVAVGVHDGTVLAAGEDGGVGRYAGDDWERLGTVEDPRAVDGPLVAAGDGVHRVVGGELEGVGLDDARDVAGRGVPLAATAAGLYYLGNGWMDAADGGHRVVDSDGGRTHIGNSDGTRAHAVADDGTVRAGTPTGDWADVDLPTGGDVVGFAYTEAFVVAATESGDLLVDAGDGWRARALGVRDVGGVAVP